MKKMTYQSLWIFSALALQACVAVDAHELSQITPSPSPSSSSGVVTAPSSSPTPSPSSSPSPSPSPSHSALLTLTTDHSQYTVGQLATLLATATPAFSPVPEAEYILQSSFNSKPVNLSPLGATRWMGSVVLSQPGQFQWTVHFNTRNRVTAAPYENELRTYAEHIVALQKELNRPGLTAAQKEAIESQIANDQAILRQVAMDLQAMTKTLESDSLMITVNPSPTPMPSVSHSMALDGEEQ